MDTQHWEALRRDLERRQDELKRLIVDNERTANERLRAEAENGETVDFTHPADNVEADPDFEKEIRLVHRERAELALVDHALSRIKNGTYGRCEECGGEIDLARLKAVPFAKYCKDDQNLVDDEARPPFEAVRVAPPTGP